jgi:dienelactone hydrolase
LRNPATEAATRKLAGLVFLSSALWAVSVSAQEGTKLREEIAVPVDYQGRQIQLTGWFEKPIGAGPFPVVIALHSCSGYTANLYSGALPLWVPFLQGQGYATFKLDSFTARGYSEVCATQAVTAADRAPDVLAAAARCCRTPGRQARLYRGDRLVAWRRHRGLRRARLLGIAAIAGATGGSRR